GCATRGNRRRAWRPRSGPGCTGYGRGRRAPRSRCRRSCTPSLADCRWPAAWRSARADFREPNGVASGGSWCPLLFSSAHVANDGTAVFLHLLDEVGHHVEGFIALVRKALQAQHVHLLAVAHAVNLALDDLDGSVQVALGGGGRVAGDRRDALVAAVVARAEGPVARLVVFSLFLAFCIHR